MIVVTAESVAGHRIVKTLGLVRGNTIRARHIGKDIVAGLRSIVGGERGARDEKSEDGRQPESPRAESHIRVLQEGRRFVGFYPLSGAPREKGCIQETVSRKAAISFAVVAEIDDDSQQVGA